MYKYCVKCVYPSSAVNIDIDEDGICSSCRTFEEILKLDNKQWKLREDKFI